MTLEEQYQINCETPSDINELIPILKEYYDKCDSICEFGVRGCVSLSAALVSKAKKVTAYDIMDVAVLKCDKLTFIKGSTLEVEIEPVDFLWIDTFHSAWQLKQELELHADKALKYLGFHDVFTFYENAEPSFDPALNTIEGIEKGLKYAIEPFLENNPQWKECYRTDRNNGLLILERI